MFGVSVLVYGLFGVFCIQFCIKLFCILFIVKSTKNDLGKRAEWLIDNVIFRQRRTYTDHIGQKELYVSSAKRIVKRRRVGSRVLVCRFLYCKLA